MPSIDAQGHKDFCLMMRMVTIELYLSIHALEFKIIDLFARIEIIHTDSIVILLLMKIQH